ncbi:carbohydrate ABC transporter permease [Cohnella abietis]|uniref:Sugar ABC transporter permease n=1 Tax=Cohnella abietis TaxID=2507935 RepID=A0A3T1D0Q5_9BACL|nr:sugar ABC transporter permease [Cohnella abietis]BBI31585.1 sugar ABC transporter permease [Cohnella abietis]
MKLFRYSQRTKEQLEFYALISPWFIVFLFLTLFPLLYGLYLSFTNFTGLNIDTLRNVGFNNYRRVFADNDAVYSLTRTLLITVINVPLTTIIGFMLALMLNYKVKGVGIYSSIFYLPTILPIMVTGIIWRVIFTKDGGILNQILDFVGIAPVNWLGYDNISISLLILLAWGSGGGLLIYLAGLKGISQELYESASIDGAKPFQRVMNITVPLMTPVLFFNIIMSIISSLQIFIQPIVLSSNTTNLLATPLRPNYLYSIHAFQQIFAFQRYGYGLAMLWLLFVAIVLLSIIVFYSSKYWVHYEVDQG